MSCKNKYSPVQCGKSGKKVKPLSLLHYAVLSEIQKNHVNGRTDEEIEMVLGLRHQTASARRRELVLEGLIVHSGRYRINSSNRKAKVWVDAKYDNMTYCPCCGRDF